MDKSGFYVINRFDDENKIVGFRLFFDNNYGISVIFGGFSHSDEVKVTENGESKEYFCETAEVAVLNPEGKLVPFDKDNKIMDHVLPENLPQIISWAMNR